MNDRDFIDRFHDIANTEHVQKQGYQKLKLHRESIAAENDCLKVTAGRIEMGKVPVANKRNRK